MLFVVDEASGVDDSVFNTALSSLSSPNAKVVMTSNPTRLSGFFFDAFHRNSTLWHTLTVSAFDSRLSRDGALIDMVRQRSGEDSDEWRVRVLGQFLISDEEQIVPRGLAEAAIGRDVQPNPHFLY